MNRSVLIVLLVIPALAAAEPEKSAVKVSFVVFADNSAGVSEATCGWGSGTVVHSGGGKSLVLTNRHVCPHGNGHPFVLVGNKAYPSEWIAADEAADLALVRAPVELPAVELAETEPKEGTTLRQWGFSGRGPVKPKSGPLIGTVQFKLEDGTTVDSLVTGIGVESADSGSGVFDPDGKLVAVTYAIGGPKDGPQREHCVRLTNIKRFLGRHR